MAIERRLEMTRLNKLVALVALLIIIIPLISLSLPGSASAQGGIINGGFETGDFSGWNVSTGLLGSAQVVTRFDYDYPQPGTYSAKEGTYFALLRNGQRDVWTVVSQPFHADTGDAISGFSFFKTDDYMPWNDESSVEITVNSGPQVVATVFQASVSTVGDEGGTPWTYWAYVFTSPGEYTIQAKVTNRFDSQVDSYLGLDGVYLNPLGFIAQQQQQPRSSPPMPAATPAVITVRNMQITPEQTYAGQTIAISANMANDGDQAGGYTAPLKINGKVEQTKIGPVDGHSAIPVNFTVIKYQPGTYTVDIGGQKGTFTVLAAKTSSGQSASSAAIVILIMGVLVLSTIVVLILTFRRPA
jgi:hypothetical protein